FFVPTCTTPIEIYTLSLHDALPIYLIGARIVVYYKSDVELVRDVIIKYFNSAEHIQVIPDNVMKFGYEGFHMLCFIPSTIYSDQDRKSTRLNSSHVKISYAVFCLKK